MIDEDNHLDVTPEAFELLDYIQRNSTTFDMIYASIISMARFHPGTTRDPAMRLSLEDCRAEAIRAMLLRKKVIDQ